jgi:hypothetical protein
MQVFKQEFYNHISKILSFLIIKHLTSNAQDYLPNNIQK